MQEWRTFDTVSEAVQASDISLTMKTSASKYEGLEQWQGLSTAEATALLISMRNLADDGAVFEWTDLSGKTIAVTWDRSEESFIYTRHMRRFYKLSVEASHSWQAHKRYRMNWSYKQMTPEPLNPFDSLVAVTRRAFVPRIMTQIYSTNPMTQTVCQTKPTP